MKKKIEKKKLKKMKKNFLEKLKKCEGKKIVGTSPPPPPLMEVAPEKINLEKNNFWDPPKFLNYRDPPVTDRQSKNITFAVPYGGQ